MATIKLTNQSDVIDNSYNYQYGAANHTWYLLKGEDAFYGGTGRDTVYGSDGTDFINGGDGNDVLYGDSGWDYLYGGAGTDMLYGGAGNDTLDGAWDGQYDVLSGNAGSDKIYAGGDKVDAGDGNDLVNVYMFDGGQRADVKLGLGKDTLQLELHEHDDPNYNDGRIDVLDFKANDKLVFDLAHNDYDWLDNGQVLDRLDVNNDGWLGAQDVEVYDTDEVTVHVGKNFLELDVFDTSVVMHGMTKASFDFLV